MVIWKKYFGLDDVMKEFGEYVLVLLDEELEVVIVVWCDEIYFVVV